MKILSGLAALLVLGAAAPAASATESKNLQVMSWNMCGSQRDTWNCAGTGTPDQKTDVVKYHVDHDYVQAALLQEVCEDDLTLLMSKLGPGWSKSFAPYKWSQDGVTWNSRCGNDGPDDRADRIGTAIVIKAGMADAKSYPLTQPWTGLNQPFQCATATWWDVRLCAVHLSRPGVNPDHPDWDYRDDQLKDIKNVTSGFPKVVFGGDFNSQAPDQPGNGDAWIWPADLYSKGPGTPGYTECDQDGASRTGRPTHDGGWKIDYVFSSEPRRWCAVADSAFSDHHVMIESVSVA
ncbi:MULTISPECIES: endonuclease/exonuclease/phosphatase family protein [unclassified Streptomyces]|uniref:endonuclease/exonuclease/phosphatase family protein n=1 Tax=unclassified Streptomyces TaxID=2593676 RepID=UPI001EF02431|nr:MULTISPECIES: endonuclease/exonuclease/phosphatase family protein [unclassified Streptomyces]